MKIFCRLLLVVVLLCACAVGASFYSYYVPRSGEAKTVFIEPKTRAQALLQQLHAEGLLPPLPLVVLPLMLGSDYQMLKAGEYAFPAGMTPAEVIAKVTRGEVVVHKVTIPEGWSSFQVRDALLKEPLLTGELPAIAEGSLLPDTMHFQRGESRASVIARMQKAQNELMAKLWPTRMANLPLMTPQEVLILASIVEKETGEVDERTLVAGVFVNRLRLGMPLQSDPTVVYGVEMGQGGRPMGRELSRADLQRDTIYNTYTRNGLTPTPICNPGRKAIEAVLNPAHTEALYFVATGTGGHRFAATLKEHEANVVAYRKVMRELKAR